MQLFRAGERRVDCRLRLVRCARVDLREAEEVAGMKRGHMDRDMNMEVKEDRVARAAS